MKHDFLNASESFKRLNPDLYRLGSMEAGQSKPTATQALVNPVELRKRRKNGVVARVSFVVLNKRTMDSDNLIASLKPLRDAVAESLGLDDSDRFITWEYQQVQTRCKEGVIVKIEVSEVSK